EPDEILGAVERDASAGIVAGLDQDLDVTVAELDGGDRAGHQRRIVGQVARRLAEPIEPRAVTRDRLAHPRRGEPGHRLEHDPGAADLTALAMRDHGGDLALV